MKNNPVIIFIVDDDKAFVALLKNEIKRNFNAEEIIIFSFELGELCQSFLNNKPDIAIVDYHMNSRYKNAMNGVKVMDMIKKSNPDTEIILFTADDNLGLAVEAFQHGAHDYVVKNNYMFRRLNVAILQCLKIRKIKQEFSEQKQSRLISALIISAGIVLATALPLLVMHLMK